MKEINKITRMSSNRLKLIRYRSFTHGWNGYSADPIKVSVIDKVENEYMNFIEVPKMFPTNNGNIQLEFYIDDDNQVEAEITEDMAEVLIVQRGVEKEMEVPFDELFRIVQDFYAENEL